MLSRDFKHKFSVFLLFMGAYAFFYILPNLHPRWAPTYLPLTWIDEITPFVPWTFGIYLSIYLLLVLTPFFIKDLDTFNTLSRRMFITLFVCGAFFLFFPTKYPRPTYPVTDSAIVNFFMWLVGTADTPNNCFPSLHVAGTGMTTYSLRHQGKTRFRIYLAWTAVIWLSTLTTKQHYFVDILGGAAVVFTVACLDRVLFEKRVLKGLFPR